MLRSSCSPLSDWTHTVVGAVQSTCTVQKSMVYLQYVLTVRERSEESDVSFPD